MSKIKKITVSNLKAISAYTADFNGATAIITAGNNKGKTSLLRALADRLRGIKADVILKQGEKDGNYEMELTTGEKFVWQFDSKKEKLTFITEKNIPTGVTKEISRHFFPPVFDVDNFLNSTPKDQKKTLQKLTGIDFTEIDKLYKEAYDARTYQNKRVVEEKAKLTYYDPKMPIVPQPSEELEKELNGIEAHNLRYNTLNEKLQDKKNQFAAKEKEIQALREKIVSIEAEKTLLLEDTAKGEAWINETKNKPKTNEAELKAKLKDINDEAKEIEENNKARIQQETFDKAVINAQAADAEVFKIEQEKLDVIKNAAMPEGFGFSEDGITYNGFAFTKEQLSSSGLYIAALKLAAIGLGDVKTLHFDASFLDNNSLADIEKWATENKLQLLIEMPDRAGGDIQYEIIQP